MTDNHFQTQARSYRLAADDAEFIRGDSMRGVHLLLEYARAEEQPPMWTMPRRRGGRWSRPD